MITRVELIVDNLTGEEEVLVISTDDLFTIEVSDEEQGQPDEYKEIDKEAAKNDKGNYKIEKSKKDKDVRNQKVRVL